MGCWLVCGGVDEEKTVGCDATGAARGLMPLCAVGVGDVVELDVGGGGSVLSGGDDLGTGEAEEGDASLLDEVGVEGAEGDVVGELVVVGGVADLLDCAERGVLGVDTDGAALRDGSLKGDVGLGEDGSGREEKGCEGDEWAHGMASCERRIRRGEGEWEEELMFQNSLRRISRLKL
jgi:hypothetical protein